MNKINHFHRRRLCFFKYDKAANNSRVGGRVDVEVTSKAAAVVIYDNQEAYVSVFGNLRLHEHQVVVYSIVAVCYRWLSLNFARILSMQFGFSNIALKMHFNSAFAYYYCYYHYKIHFINENHLSCFFYETLPYRVPFDNANFEFYLGIEF